MRLPAPRGIPGKAVDLVPCGAVMLGLAAVVPR